MDASAAAPGPSERVADVLGTPTLVRETGEGPAILFLHGLEEPRWCPALAGLASEFHVVAPDHPGMGRTPLGPGIESMDDLIHHYLALLDTLGLDAPTLIGASFGGWVAAELAVAAGHRLRRLVLADAAGLRVNEEDLPEIYLHGDSELGEFLVAEPENAGLVFPPTDDLEIIERRLIQRATLARFTWQPYWHNPRLLERLHRIESPTLVLWGSEDRFIPPAHAKAFVERIPRATLHMISGAGHLPHLERPERFSEAVSSFIRSTA